MSEIAIVRYHPESPSSLDLFVPSISGSARLAKLFAGLLRGPFSLGLSGPLGVGKTEFARNLLSELGVSAAEVVSPSFVLEAVYETSEVVAKRTGLFQVCHWDLYRIQNRNNPEDLLEELSAEHSLVLVEWPERGELDNLLSVEIMIGFRPLSTEAHLPVEQADSRYYRFLVANETHRRASQAMIEELAQAVAEANR